MPGESSRKGNLSAGALCIAALYRRLGLSGHRTSAHFRKMPFEPGEPCVKQMTGAAIPSNELFLERTPESGTAQLRRAASRWCSYARTARRLKPDRPDRELKSHPMAGNPSSPVFRILVSAHSTAISASGTKAVPKTPLFPYTLSDSSLILSFGAPLFS